MRDLPANTLKTGGFMKKGRRIVCCISVLLCVWFSIAHMPVIVQVSRFLRYQNIGRISLEIDGNETALNNIDITLNLNEVVKKGKIRNGKFKFWNGVKGHNTCKFKIPAKIYGGQTDIFFEADYISVYDGNINNFNIDISIITDDGIRVYATGVIKIESYIEPYEYDFEAVSKEITEKDNVIKLILSD